jgi:hypothetical protein
MNLRVWRPAVGLWLCACLALAAAEGRRGGSKGGANQPKQNSTCLDVPAHPIDVVLCRPTDLPPSEASFRLTFRMIARV